MPLYDFYCDCGYKEERVIGMDDPAPTCPNCHKDMVKRVGKIAYVYMKGEGGYPARRKQIFNTTMRRHPKLKGGYINE